MPPAESIAQRTWSILGRAKALRPKKIPELMRNPERFRYHKVGGLGPEYD